MLKFCTILHRKKKFIPFAWAKYYGIVELISLFFTFFSSMEINGFSWTHNVRTMGTWGKKSINFLLFEVILIWSRTELKKIGYIIFNINYFLGWLFFGIFWSKFYTKVHSKKKRFKIFFFFGLFFCNESPYDHIWRFIELYWLIERLNFWLIEGQFIGGGL